MVPGAGLNSLIYKGFAWVWGIIFVPHKNITSVSEGRNRDNRGNLVKLVL